MPAPIEPEDENTFACTDPPRKKVRSLSDVRDGGREKSRVLGFSAKRASEARLVPHAGGLFPWPGHGQMSWVLSTSIGMRFACRSPPLLYHCEGFRRSMRSAGSCRLNSLPPM